MGSLALLWVPCAFLTNPIPGVTSMPFDSKTNEVGDKVYPPYFKIQAMTYCVPDTSLLWSLTFIQKQHRRPECLWDYMVDLSSNVVLLDSARVWFL
jgi:hypothetical protein